MSRMPLARFIAVQLERGSEAAMTAAWSQSAAVKVIVRAESAAGMASKRLEEAPASVFEKPGQAGRETPRVRAKGLDRPKQPQNLSYSAPSEQGEVEVAASAAAGPGEIALSVVAEIVAEAHGRPGGPLRDPGR